MQISGWIRGAGQGSVACLPCFSASFMVLAWFLWRFFCFCVADGSLLCLVVARHLTSSHSSRRPVPGSVCCHGCALGRTTSTSHTRSSHPLSLHSVEKPPTSATRFPKELVSQQLLNQKTKLEHAPGLGGLWDPGSFVVRLDVAGNVRLVLRTPRVWSKLRTENQSRSSNFKICFSSTSH